MKYTIEGFSQEYAATLKKQIERKGKIITIKIDFTDLIILRWFVDFYPSMKKIIVDGKEYAWLLHNKLQADLPLLDISARSCNERMHKLVEFEILEYTLLKQEGTFSLYRFGKNYINLIARGNSQYEETAEINFKSISVSEPASETKDELSVENKKTDNKKILRKSNMQSLSQCRKMNIKNYLKNTANPKQKE